MSSFQREIIDLTIDEKEFSQHICFQTHHWSSISDSESDNENEEFMVVSGKDERECEMDVDDSHSEVSTLKNDTDYEEENGSESSDEDIPVGKKLKAHGCSGEKWLHVKGCCGPLRTEVRSEYDNPRTKPFLDIIFAAHEIMDDYLYEMHDLVHGEEEVHFRTVFDAIRRGCGTKLERGYFLEHGKEVGEQLSARGYMLRNPISMNYRATLPKEEAYLVMLTMNFVFNRMEAFHAAYQRGVEGYWV